MRKGLTPKERKTPKTRESLHVCSRVDAVGIGKEVIVERVGRKDRKIWSEEDHSVVKVDSISLPILSPVIELERMKLMISLNKSFFNIVLKITGKVPPVMTFERWLARSKLREVDHDDPTLLDPVIPSIGAENNDPWLIKDLGRVGITEEKAKEISLELAMKSFNLVKTLKSQRQPTDNSHKLQQVKVKKNKYTHDVILNGALLKINDSHYEKLHNLFLRYGVTEVEKEDKEAVTQKFHQALFVLLARYKGIQGHGYQAACGEKVFQALTKHYGVSMELFGSPLNCYYSRYCSAFIDTDWCFGAVNNFFHFRPTSGCYECNPPFIPSVMIKAVHHIHNLLYENTKNSFTFVIVVPGWLDDEAIIQLEASEFLTEKYSISKDEHGFCDGAQHQRKDRYRESPFDTFFYILQTDQGKLEFPTTEKVELEIRQSMATAIPTEAMKQRRLKKGRGFCEADGGGGVYKGKRKNKKGAQNQD